MPGPAKSETKDNVSPEPVIKLARDMTTADKEKMLGITGGSPRYLGRHLSGRQPELGLKRIDLPQLGARIDFTSVGQKIEDWGYAICIGGQRHSLEEAAVVFRDSSVSFVFRPKGAVVIEAGVTLETITIEPNKLSHEITFYSSEEGIPENDISQAADFVDKALMPKYSRGSL